MSKIDEKSAVTNGRQRVFNHAAVALMIAIMAAAAVAWGGMVFNLLPF